MRKKRLNRKLLAMIMGVSILLVGVIVPETTLKVQAAEPPGITVLEVAAAADGTGIIARCNYSNYTEQSGCEARLYLYQVESGRESIKAQKALAYAEQGSESTEPIQPEEGIYRASVAMDYGVEIKQINSQNYYRVVQVDDNYVVEEEAADKPQQQENSPQEMGACAECSHESEYVVERQATAAMDAMLAYKCIKCGAVLKYMEVPNSAYATFLRETTDLILNAQSQEAIITTDRWMSFNRAVFEAMMNRPEITVIVNYQYKGETNTLIIPAGADVELFMDESGFGGFRHMEELLKTE